MNVLDRIVSATLEDVERRRSSVPLSELESQLAQRPEGRPFTEALLRPGISLIAEHKRRSPSAGDIRAGATVTEIVAALHADDLAVLHREARGLDLDVLVEVHDEDELECALEVVEADVIGINNRDLTDFSVDLDRTFELLSDVPAGKTVVSESGIHTRDQLDELERVGVDAVLVGESLMRPPDIEGAVRALTGEHDVA